MLADRVGDLRTILPSAAGEFTTGYESVHPGATAGTGGGDWRIL